MLGSNIFFLPAYAAVVTSDVDETVVDLALNENELLDGCTIEPFDVTLDSGDFLKPEKLEGILPASRFMGTGGVNKRKPFIDRNQAPVIWGKSKR